MHLKSGNGTQFTLSHRLIRPMSGETDGAIHGQGSEWKTSIIDYLKPHQTINWQLAYGDSTRAFAAEIRNKESHYRSDKQSRALD